MSGQSGFFILLSQTKLENQSCQLGVTTLSRLANQATQQQSNQATNQPTTQSSSQLAESIE